MVENLDEVNARSVPQDIERGLDSSIASTASRNSIKTLSQSIDSQYGSSLIGSGVLPPKVSRIPTVDPQYNSPLNNYNTIR